MSKAAVINIDMGTVCPSCGNKGATINDQGEVMFCIECVSKKIEKQLSCKIGPNVIAKVENMIRELLVTYQNDMDKAYKTTGDEPFKVGISIKMEPGDRGDVEIETAIAFTTGKVKDKTTGSANEAQQELFPE